MAGSVAAIICAVSTSKPIDSKRLPDGDQQALITVIDSFVKKAMVEKAMELNSVKR
ncbi:hypothetical protein U7S25_003577 [Providencia rettgeri]|nr:hypothetical protein [Providencia rettgeri]ELR5136112.1 hypothetical protein [Providencia rettgeri]ELR5189060.1 hypothetical protein [Providencia rettgeri]EMB0752879.1 hypothetical protein [Providencia rettgeri]